MMLEIFILLEVIMLIFFGFSFYTKQEILWAITALFSGVLMFTSYNIEIFSYVFDSSLGAYTAQLVSYNFMFLMAINFIFFALSIVLGFFDIYDKYGISTFNIKNPKTPQ